jgi:hypothetical protein
MYLPEASSQMRPCSPWVEIRSTSEGSGAAESSSDVLAAESEEGRSTDWEESVDGKERKGKQSKHDGRGRKEPWKKDEQLWL